MKRIALTFKCYGLILYFFFSGFHLLSQNSIVIQPGPDEGKDARVWSLDPESNFANYDNTKLNAWTWGGTFGIERTFIEFDLHEIPPGVEIEEALLSLFYHFEEGSPEQTHFGDNKFLIQRTTSDWMEDDVTWVNQPGLTTQNQVEVPPSQDPQQDYLDIDVTELVLDALNSATDSAFGIGLKLEIEETYRRVGLSSSDHLNQNMWPKLEVFYSCFVDLGNDTTLCEGDTLLLSTGPEFTSYLWSDESTDSTLMVTTSGTYWVNVWDDFDCFAGDTINIEFVPNPDSILNLGPDTTLCNSDSLLLIVNGNFSSYQWQDGSTDSVFMVSQTGNYSVTITNDCGMAADSISVVISDEINLDLGNDTVICGTDTLLLFANEAFSEYFWSTGSTEPIIEISSSGQFWLEVTNEFGCSATDSIDVIFGPDILSNFSLGQDTTLCPGESIMLSAGSGFDTCYWQNGSNDPEFYVTQAGEYIVTVGNLCGETSDTINVSFYADLEVNLGNDTTLCNNETLWITPGSNFQSYLWQDGSIANDLLVYASGIYSVEVTDHNNCSNGDEITISYLNVEVDLGPDTSICENSEFYLTADSSYSGILWNDVIAEEQVLVDHPDIYWVEVYDSDGQKYCYGFDTILIQYKETPSPGSILSDYSFCPNDSITITAPFNGNFTYFWSTGSPENTISLKNPGNYYLTTLNECDTVFDFFTVTTFPEPEPEIISDTIRDGELIHLSLSEFYENYQWSDGSSSSYIEIDYNGVFYVSVRNEYNCFGIDSITINPFDCITFVPTVFTPNYDFSNDLFFIDASNVDEFDLKILNRWGELVFESNDKNFEWDGTSKGNHCAEGTYFWIINYSCTKLSGDFSKRLLKGNVTLLR